MAKLTIEMMTPVQLQRHYRAMTRVATRQLRKDRKVALKNELAMIEAHHYATADATSDSFGRELRNKIDARKLAEKEMIETAIQELEAELSQELSEEMKKKYDFSSIVGEADQMMQVPELNH